MTASDSVLRLPSISGAPSPRAARANSSSSSTMASFFSVCSASAFPLEPEFPLGFPELADRPRVDLALQMPEVRLAPPLVAEREHHFRLAAGLGDGAAVRHSVGDRLVEKDVLAGLRCGARGFEVHGI